MTAHSFIIHCFDQLGLPFLTKTTLFLICSSVWSQTLRHSISRFLNQIFSQFDLFSIRSFLNSIFSQFDLFSIGSFLNRIFSQSDLFSIESFWGRHRQLDDSLVGQLTRVEGIKLFSYWQSGVGNTYSALPF